MIGEYGPTLYLIVVDDDYFAARQYDIKHKTEPVEECLKCGALVRDGSKYIHDEYHRTNDLDAEVN